MPSSYSTNLKIELQATGENSGTWGTITNTNLGTALEQAIVGYGNPNYASDANLTLTYTDTNAAQAARALVLNVTSAVSLSTTRELVVPTIQKQYIVQNNTTGSQSITVKTSAGTGITVPNGRKAHLYVDGTNVIYMDDYVDINGGAIDGTPIGANSASTGAFSTLSATGNVNFDGGTFTFNDSGADRDFRVEGDTDANLLFSDASTDRIGIGTNTPATKLDVNGTITATAVNTTTLDLTNLEVTNIKAKDGTSAASIADSTGVVSFTANPILSGGTANGVLYLNGSKVATSGSALTFDGTKLAVGGTATEKISTNGALRVSGSTTSAATGIVISQETTTNGYISVYGPDNSTTGQLVFYLTSANGTTAGEQMRLTSTGLGIGTSSPSVKLDVYGSDPRIQSSNSTATVKNILLAGGSLGYVGMTTNHALAFITNDTERARIDTSGNLGIGTSSPQSLLNTASTGQVQIGTASWPSTFIGKSGARTLVGNEGVLVVWNEATAAANNAATLYIGPKGSGTNGATVIAGGAISGASEDGSTNKGYLRFDTNGGSGNAEKMRLDSSGNLGIGTSSPGAKLEVAGQTNVKFANPDTTGILLEATTGTNAAAMTFKNTGGNGFVGLDNSAGSRVGGGAYTLNVWHEAAYGVAFGTNNTLRMIIDSSGNVGIGTSSPSSAIEVLRGSSAPAGISLRGNNNAAAAELFVGQGSSGDAYVYQRANKAIIFGTNNSDRATLDSSGNLGLGVTPSAWSGLKAIQVENASLAGWTSDKSAMYLSSNSYYDGSNYKYISNEAANQYRQQAGAHAWYNAASGTAGGTISFTQAMTLDASGRLMVGGTSAFAADTVTIDNSGFIGVRNTSGSCLELRRDTSDGSILDFQSGSTVVGTIGSNAASGTPVLDISANSSSGIMRFLTSGSERVRITSDGNFVIKSGAAVATNSLDSPFFYRIAGGGLSINANAESPGSAITFSTSNTERARITGDGELLIGTTSDSGAFKLQVAGDALMTGGNALYFRDTGAYAFSPASNVLAFSTNSVERARITSDGYFLIGLTTTTGSGKFTNYNDSAATAGVSSNTRIWNQVKSTAASNNATVDAWIGRDAGGNVIGNGFLVGHFYVYVSGASGANGFSGVYSIVTTGNGTSEATLAAVSTVSRGTNPVSSIQIANDGGSGAIKLTVTYINNSGIVTGGTSQVSFVGQVA